MAELTLKDESVIQIGETVSKGFNDLVASGKSILINPAGQPLTQSAADIPTENDFIGPRLPESSEENSMLSILENIRDGIMSLVDTFTESLSFQKQEEQEQERQERISADDPTPPEDTGGDTSKSIFASAMEKFAAIKEGAANLLSKEGFIGMLIKGGLIASLLFLAKMLNTYGKQIAEAISPIVDGLKRFFGRLFQDIGPMLKDAFSIISDTFTGLFDLVKGIFTLDGDLIMKGLDAITQIPKRIFEFLINAAGTIINSIGALFGAEGDVTTTVKNFFIDLENKVKEAFQNAIAFFTEDIPNAVSNITTEIGNFFKDTFDKIKNSIKNVFTSIGDFFSSIGDGIKSFINSAIDALPLPGFLKKKLKLETKATREADERITDTGIKGKYVDESITGMQRERMTGGGATMGEGFAEFEGEKYGTANIVGPVGAQVRGILSGKELNEFMKLDDEQQMDYLRNYDEKEYKRRMMVMDLYDKEYSHRAKLARMIEEGKALQPEFGGEIVSPDDQLLMDNEAYANRTRQMREDSAAMQRRDEGKVNVVNTRGGDSNVNTANNTYTNIMEDTNTSDNSLRNYLSA
jgi:hypothetical protein